MEDNNLTIAPMRRPFNVENDRVISPDIEKLEEMKQSVEEAEVVEPKIPAPAGEEDEETGLFGGKKMLWIGLGLLGAAILLRK